MRTENRRKITEPLKTFDIDEFMEINCFFCLARNMKLTPEGCFKLIYEGFAGSPKGNICLFQCQNNIFSDYIDVFLRRMKRTKKETENDSFYTHEELLNDFFTRLHQSIETREDFDEDIFTKAMKFVITKETE